MNWQQVQTKSNFPIFGSKSKISQINGFFQLGSFSLALRVTYARKLTVAMWTFTTACPLTEWQLTSPTGTTLRPFLLRLRVLETSHLPLLAIDDNEANHNNCGSDDEEKALFANYTSFKILFFN